MDFEEGKLCGVGGSPLKSLEVFSLSSSQVPSLCMCIDVYSPAESITIVTSKCRVPYFFNQTQQLLCCTFLVQLLFEGGVYFLGKPVNINQGLDKVHTSDTVMTFNSMCSLSVLLSAVETSHITQIILHILRIVVVATI